jgi:biotin synthase
MTWTREKISEVYNTPLMELLYKAATVHREHHNPLDVQMSSLISIKTGGCPEDCGYCPQAARYHTDIDGHKLMPVDQVVEMAQNAKANGSSRVCMGAAWRNVRDNKEFDQVLEMVRAINGLDMEVCCTLGMLTEDQAKRLEKAGLYAYNHNVDTSEDFYEDIISTREYKDRLNTIDNVRKTGISVCSGGIIGMGEKPEHRIGMLETFAKMENPPESVPINALVPVEGTPLENQETASIWEMVRMIATTRIVLPESIVRLSAGRTQMTKEGQALCFMAGASSIFAGDTLLTTPNPEYNDDLELFKILGLNPKEPFVDGQRPDIVEDEVLEANKAKEQERLAKQKANAEKAKANSFEPRKVVVE